MGVGYNPRIVTDGLVFCLDAANKRSYPGSGTTWTDRSANGYDGTLTNMDASNFSSDNGGTLSFDGSNEYVNFGDILDDKISDSLSIGIFCKPLSLTGTQNIFSKGSSYWLHKENTTQKFRFKIETNNGREEVQANLNLSTDKFYFIVGILNQQSIEIYVDGLRYAQSSFSGTFSKTNYDLRAGGWWTGSDNFNGIIGNAFIYNRALSADEVRQNYEATVGRFS